MSRPSWLTPPPIDEIAVAPSAPAGGLAFTRRQRDWLNMAYTALADIGEWKHVAYADAAFTANSGTWTVSESAFVLYAYRLFGTVLEVSFSFQGVTITGAGNELRVTLPPGLDALHRAANANFSAPLLITGDNGPQWGYALTRPATTGTHLLGLFRLNGTSWVDSAAGTGVAGRMTLEVEP